VDVIETERLLLRRPRALDAPAIFARYASDPDVTRYMSWLTHRSVDETYAFVRYCDDLWERWPLAGPMLIFARDGVTLIGGAGIVNDTATMAQIGYVLARDAWGRGYATEALLASVEGARVAGLRRLEAGVHVDHRVSCRVLEKAGFTHEGVRPGRPADFPNLPADATRDAALYATSL
jgi:[ribosomal protein S5]-alanine N-acetyltransferase